MIPVSEILGADGQGISRVSTRVRFECRTSISFHGSMDTKGDL